MINRTRTLLMNCGRDGNSLALPGEEYIPADYAKRQLPLWLQRVHRTLFGASPDRLFINYRMRQIMQLIHATQLSSHVAAQETDITYLPFRNDLGNTVFGQTVDRQSDTSIPVYVHGEHAADETLGQTSYAWEIQVTAEDEVSITQQVPVRHTVTIPLVFAAGLSAVIPLIPSKLSTRFGQVDTGFKYRVQSVVQPVRDISAVLQTSITAESLDSLSVFNTAISEHQAMYADIWLHHQQFAMRYAAVLLAIANFIETQGAAQ